MNAPKCVRGIVLLFWLSFYIALVAGADATPPLLLQKFPSDLIDENDFDITVLTDENAVCRYDELDLIFEDMAFELDGNLTEHTRAVQLVDGDYSYYMRCQDTAGNSMVNPEVLSFVVDSTGGSDRIAPIVVSVSPEGVVPEGVVQLYVETNEPSTCRFTADDSSYDLMPVSNTFSGTIEHRYDLSLQGGNHGLFVKCKDAAGNIMSSSYEIKFSIDNNPPDVLEHSPTNVNQNSFEVQISTDEFSYCRYSTISNTDYDEMNNAFEVTGDIVHRAPLHFESDGFHRIYVKCKDHAGNENENDYVAGVDVDVPPFVQITLSESSPLSYGTVYVTIVTSEDLIGVPELSYTLYNSNGESNTYKIPLSGSGDVWTGFMIIGKSQDKKIGSFSFNGVDFGGNVGNQITQGNTFIVDSSMPSQIDAFIAREQVDSSIKLSWTFEDDQDIVEYHIYRALSSGVTVFDYYDKTDDKDYIDEDLVENTEYYYRVVAVDSAGNEGSLSKEVSARSIFFQSEYSSNYDSSADSSTNSGTTSATNDIPLKSNLVPLVNVAIKRAESFNKAAENAVYYFKGKTSLSEETVTDLKLLGSASQVKGVSMQHIVSLEALKSKDTTEAELELAIRSIEVKIDSLKDDLPTSASEIKTLEITSDSSMESVVSSVDGLMNLYRIIDLDEKIRDNYIKESSKLTSTFDFGGSARVIEVVYNDATTKQFMIVERSVSQSGDSQVDGTDLFYVESIPSIIAEKATEITHITGKPEIMKIDTVLKWNLASTTSSGLKYYVEGDFSSLDSLSIPATVLDNHNLYFDEFGNPAEAVKETNNLLTGNVIGFFSGIKDSLGDVKKVAGVILGVLAVMGLGIYYFTMDGPVPNVTEKFNKVKNSAGAYFKRKNNAQKSVLRESVSSQEFSLHESSIANGSPSEIDVVQLNSGFASNDELPTPKSDTGLNHINYGDAEMELPNNHKMMKMKENGIKSLGNNGFTEMLNHANLMIDKLQFNDANKLYFKLITNLEKFSFAEPERTHVAQTLEQLHKKLTLYLKIHSANVSFGKKDFTSLYSHVNEIADHYNIVSGDSNDSDLLKYARQMHERHTTFLLNNTGGHVSHNS